jgi:tRNA-uridine 2-sulfurtransferase
MRDRNPERILVAMSGGVDSSVAASLLAGQGHEILGCSLDLLTCRREGARSCCSARDRMDARAVCEQLKVSYQVLDCRLAFREAVIQPFVETYLRGRTPSPCIRCNQRIKFPLLLAEADRQGVPLVATGHYARVAKDGACFRLLRGADRKKDQSYFLFTLTQGELARLVLPLGSWTKAEVRAEAGRRGLPTSEKAESQEICFVPDDDYVRFVEEQAGARLSGPGDFVDGSGRAVGRHAGIHAYTVGQRRGLGFGAGRRQYVAAIDAVENRVVLGTDADLFRAEIVVGEMSWVLPENALARDAVVQVRSKHEGAAAALEPLKEGRTRVRFAEPVRAPAPGQAAVFYRGDEVLGGGWIE